MNGVLLMRRRRRAAAAVVLAVLAAGAAVQGCGADSQAPVPLTAGLNQFRDNYSTQIIEIQLSNTSAAPVTVLSAEVSSPLFPAGIAWQTEQAGTEVPPGQTKSLPAKLPAPSCDDPGVATGPGETGAGPAPAEVKVSVRRDSILSEEHLAAPDPYGVLTRNHSELCLAQEAQQVAVIGLAPELEVAADGRTAVVRLQVRPLEAGTGTARSLTVESVDGTTLLAEAPEAPWPRGITFVAGGDDQEVRLRIRPARCDPHAVAEDKVGTLLPLRVEVGGRHGVLKVAAGPELKGRLYHFVTAACAAH